MASLTYPERYYHVYRVGRDLAPSEFIKARAIGDHPYKIFDTFEETITAILNVTEYKDIPRNINLDYRQFNDGPVPLRELITTARTAVGLASSRFGGGYESVKINFRIGKPISKVFSEYLKSIGVDNLTPTPSYWGAETWLKSADQMILGLQSWPEFLVIGNEDCPICSVLKPEYKINLTPRQKEISELIVRRGLSNKQIARHLNISESAVKLHIGTILKKYGLKNRTQLSRALSQGLTA